MRKMRKLCAVMSAVLTVAMVAPMVSGGVEADAAKSPKLSASKFNLKVGQSRVLKVKNYKKKVTFKSTKSSVAKLSAVKKTSVKVTAKKKGSCNVTATVKIGKKNKVLKCKVVVKNKDAVIVTPSEAPSQAPTATATATIDPNATATPTVTPDWGKTEWWVKDAQGNDVTIKNLFNDYFVSGVSTDLGRLRFGESSEIVKHHFGSVTMGNENKMETTVSLKATDTYPGGLAKANVDNYYATNGQGKIILNYDTLENTLKYLKANGLKLRYHAFVWHSQVQEYFFLQDYNWSNYSKEEYAAKGWPEENYHKLCDKETMTKRITDYIDQVIEYIYSHGYGDVVYAYDVINEATNGDGGNTKYYSVNENAGSIEEILTEGGSTNKFQTNGGVRTEGGKLVTSESTPEEVESMMRREGRTPANDSYWYATMGPDYLYISFLAAHNAIEKYYTQYKDQFGYKNKPSLIYNDYNQRENDHINLAKYINTACNLANNTTDVKYCDGIGLQSHSIAEGTQERMIKAIADEGLEVQVTELDDGSNGDAQAKKMKALYEIYQKYSKKGEYGMAQGDDYIGLTSVTQWGICDGDGSWKANYVFERYDSEAPQAAEGFTYKPKAAFFAVLQAGGATCGEKNY